METSAEKTWHEIIFADHHQRGETIHRLQQLLHNKNRRISKQKALIKELKEKLEANQRALEPPPYWDGKGLNPHTASAPVVDPSIAIVCGAVFTNALGEAVKCYQLGEHPVHKGETYNQRYEWVSHE